MGADLQSISTFLDRWRTSRASAMNWAAAIAAALAGVREGISTCEAIPTCQVILYLRSNPYVPSTPPRRLIHRACLAAPRARVLITGMSAVIHMAAALVMVTCASITVPSVYAQSTNDAQILPPAPDAIGGGNPFQGLGRQDESAPNRRSQFESQDPSTPSTSSSPSAGSVNPNIPPDLPPAPPTDPIDIQREKEAKEKELEEQKKAEAKEKAEAEKPPNSLANTPMKKAILEMHLHNYEQSMTHLDNIIATDPKNAEAHYLKAVIYVLTRKYDAAAAEYQQVLKSAPSQTLSRRAKAGLTKLSR